MNPPQGREFQPNDIALSPDGKSLAFVTGGAVSKLWVRGVDSVNPHELNDTDGASLPFWSPDQRSLGFFAGGKLKRIDLAAERVVTLADAPAGRGGSWNADDVIIFCAATNGPIWRISAAGGAPPSQATTLNSPREASHRFPPSCPTGGTFFTMFGPPNQRYGASTGPRSTIRARGAGSSKACTPRADKRPASLRSSRTWVCCGWDTTVRRQCQLRAMERWSTPRAMRVSNSRGTTAGQAFWNDWRAGCLRRGQHPNLTGRNARRHIARFGQVQSVDDRRHDG